MYKLEPVNWEVEFNSEANAAVISPQQDTLEVIANFRAFHDYIGLRYHSEDSYLHGNHKDASYPTNYSYSNVKLSFCVQFYGAALNWRDKNIKPSLVIEYTNNTLKYVTLGFLGAPAAATDTNSFYTGGDIPLSHSWIRWFDTNVTVEWVLGTEQGIITDPIVDYIDGILKYTPGIPYGASITINYFYCSPNIYEIDFNALKQGLSPSDENYSVVSAENIRRIQFPVIPYFFNPPNPVYTGESQEGRVVLSDWMVSGVGAYLGELPPAIPEHPYRYAEGYDDEYYRNPQKLVEVMHHLGYRKAVDFYIGASHFYDKKGKAPALPSGFTNAVLIPEAGCCSSYLAWFAQYVKNLKLKGYERIIVSISMENLQMPDEWKQLLADGVTPGQTGWFPPTCFYSPTNPQVRTYIRKVAKQHLDIIVGEGLKPVLQLGEPWWWWQEFVPGDVTTPFPGKPPCFYDAYTQQKFLSEFGYAMPRWYTSDIKITEGNNLEILNWLKEQLGEFSDFMKSIAQEYQNSQYGILFFPPSVIDKDRVPQAMRIVNVPIEHWKYPQLDYIQIEDYDWIIHSHMDKHKEVYSFAYSFFGYQEHLTEYFAGFALQGQEASSSALWERIHNAARKAVSYGMQTYIWAGTQIRRDNFMPGIPFAYITKHKNGYPDFKGVIWQKNDKGPFAEDEKNIENILDLSRLQLSRPEGRIAVNAQGLTLYNDNAATDLFAFAWYNVVPGVAYTLSDTSATQTVFIYSDNLYGNTVAIKYPMYRMASFYTGALTKVLVGFYCIAGANIAQWADVILYKN